MIKHIDRTYIEFGYDHVQEIKLLIDEYLKKNNLQVSHICFDWDDDDDELTIKLW